MHKKIFFILGLIFSIAPLNAMNFYGYNNLADYNAASEAFKDLVRQNDLKELNKRASQSHQQIWAEGLEEAILQLNVNATIILLDTGFDVNDFVPTVPAQSLLSIATGFFLPPLDQSEEVRSNCKKLYEIVRLLVDHGADVNWSSENCRSETPLVKALEDPRKTLIASLLIQKGAHFDPAGDASWPLARAASCGNSAGVALLLSHGADVTRCKYGIDVLQIACVPRYGYMFDRINTISLLQDAMNYPLNLTRRKDKICKEIARIQNRVLHGEIEDSETGYLGRLRHDLALVQVQLADMESPL